MFQYISCCSLSHSIFHHRIAHKRFNTSHVVVYQQHIRCLCKLPRVSIHLMLQFITQPVPAVFPFLVSIHLMLQFISSLCFSSTFHLVFQYISCCSLSWVTSEVLPSIRSFNTSHVVVYRLSLITMFCRIMFQYISCCSLSPSYSNWSYNPLQFQYISCCSLSEGSLSKKAEFLSFNTSHVVVYRKATALTHSQLYGFNTSHVVVYPVARGGYNGLYMFQYISCCSLSQTGTHQTAQT